MPFDDWIKQQQQFIEDKLSERLPDQKTSPSVLHQAMRYSVLGGGKRVRAFLCLATSQMFGSINEPAIDAACSVEFMHAYSLIHDDLPCMDDDDMRRGQPSCHKKFGEATALLAGDALQALAFQCLANSCSNESIQLLCQSAGSQGMVGGQVLDLSGQAKTIDNLQEMHLRKTGALIRSSILLGALSQSAPGHAMEKLDTFSRQIGLLFQVVDDLLDVQGTQKDLGKTPGKDAQLNKVTYVSLLGLALAQKKADDLEKAAYKSLAHFQEKAEHLIKLTEFTAKRFY